MTTRRWGDLFAAAICAVALAGPVAATAGEPAIKSAAALVMDQETGEVLYSKNVETIAPIASITKLMTALVTLEAGLDLNEEITVTKDDVEATRGSGATARLRPGAKLSREDLLRLALMSSDNRAAAALGRAYPGGMDHFVEAMNAKAQLLAMHDSRFVEPTGLQSANVSTPEDLAKLVRAAHEVPLIREFSTAPKHAFVINGRTVEYGNTNALVKSGDWDIGVSKTGFIRQAGRCLVMQARVAARSVIIVLLDSVGTYTRLGDAVRIREWLEPGYVAPSALVAAPSTRSKPTARATAKSTTRALRPVNGRVNEKYSAR